MYVMLVGNTRDFPPGSLTTISVMATSDPGFKRPTNPAASPVHLDPRLSSWTKSPPVPAAPIL